jgi:asparagine synthase (glutamine-hydrolysing)
MCGIVGIVRSDGPPPERHVIERMCRAIVHRGPDSRGTHLDDQAGLGIQRLAIIDVETGDQPIYNEDGSVVVVLNGEIYNFRELRRSLERRGHRFTTQSDTEAIVHLYEERGVNCVKELDGMFGLALWDARARRLLLARDRMGEKPLFYANLGGTLCFASELAALLECDEVPREVDPLALDAYFAYRYVPSPMCAFRAVRKLPAATRLVFEQGRLALDRYWRVDFSQKLSGSDEELLDGLREHLRDAVRQRLIADVPIGAFLSGGIDSTAVVATMAELSAGPVKTFSIGFDDPKLDERSAARAVADRFATNHEELLVRPAATDILPKLIRHYGEPFADATAIPTFYLSEMTRRHVTVALNGDGGDEIFGGYPRYVVNRYLAGLGRLPDWIRGAAVGIGDRITPKGQADSTANRVRRSLRSLGDSPPARYRRYMTDFQGLDRRAVYTPDFAAAVLKSDVSAVIERPWQASGAENIVDMMLDVDQQTYLPDDLLFKADIATMAYSLEGRAPMLDHRLVQYAASLPIHLKICGRRTKVGLRRLIEGSVPSAIVNAKKRGFQPPLAGWLRGDLRHMAYDVLLDPIARDRGLFSPGPVEQLLDDHVAGRADNAQAIWTLLMFELWHQKAGVSPMPRLRSTRAHQATDAATPSTRTERP